MVAAPFTETVFVHRITVEHGGNAIQADCYFVYRITMEYGGSDISRCLHWLLCRSGARLPAMKLTEATGILQLQEIKEAFCHLDQVSIGAAFMRFWGLEADENAGIFLVYGPAQ